ncbi:mitochondrial ribosomal protein L23 [Laetiporus sulphureus 93-53]|uniref:Large ribosomal subunit protein uL23m n=1 Tax=Laetiporus sulphureus 93-53 TaxID=1314785 RepID=A0A165EN41_9APHY|nr:mitochondrial ribosomal protein L23 [Laetiporus sulphureus 93-53]KZT07406.1 mitochondrial ribosomal protein L23 [Laetiporus sulphureus 93-53]
MQSCFRRLYATIPDAAAVARTVSTPRAVRLRRMRIHKTKHPKLPIESDATPEGLTPSEVARYNRELAKGNLMKDGGNVTAKEWLDKLNEKRNRLRGVREITNEQGEKELQFIGQKIYLPNIIIRMVRNYTPPGHPYNPYEATFRTPMSMTKTDMRSYLLAVYGVKTTYIRTDNYISPVLRSLDRSFSRTIKHKTYKRAVVGLVDPFYFPQAMEDMTKEEREKRKGKLEEDFQLKSFDETRRGEYLRISRQGSKNWKWRTGVTAKRGKILEIISSRRAARESAVEEAKTRLLKNREATQSEATA